jgi:hypothetical protein
MPFGIRFGRKIFGRIRKGDVMLRLSLTCIFTIIGANFLSAEIIIPQLALGGGYECIVLVSNKSDSGWFGSLESYQGREEPWKVNWRHPLGIWVMGHVSTGMNIYPNSTLKYRIFLNSSEVQTGYLAIDGNDGSEDDQLVVSYFYVYKDSQGHLIDSTGVPILDSGTSFVFPVERTPNINTGFAMAPGSVQDPFQVSLTLFDQEGDEFQALEMDFEGHLSRFFSEVFEDVPLEFIGMVRIDSVQPIYLTALRLETTETGFQLTSTPPSPADQP